MILQNLIAAAGTTLLTVPAGLNYAVVNIMVCNYVNAERTVDVHVIKQGNAASPTTTIIKSRTMRAYDSLFLSTEKILLSAGDSIYLIASADSSLSATVSFIAI
jgi:hypothetical protein